MGSFLFVIAYWYFEEVESKTLPDSAPHDYVITHSSSFKSPGQVPDPEESAVRLTVDYTTGLVTPAVSCHMSYQAAVA